MVKFILKENVGNCSLGTEHTFKPLLPIVAYGIISEHLWAGQKRVKENKIQNKEPEWYSRLGVRPDPGSKPPHSHEAAWVTLGQS